MNETEFYQTITNLEAAFIGRVPKDFDGAKAAWYRELRWASKSTFSKAISDLIKHERFPVLGQVLSSCNDQTPKTDCAGYYLHKKNCYKEIQTERIQCGCESCHPEFWCKAENCTWPVAARMKPIAGVPRSIDYCPEHFERGA